MTAPRIASLTCVWPTAADPGHGLFIRRRLRHVAALAPLRVVAPLAAVDYGHPQRRFFENWRLPRACHDEGLAVDFPRFFYPPFGGALNAGCLAARLIPFLSRLRREFPFDILDAHHGHPDGVAAAIVAARLGCPFAVTLRGNETRLGAGGPLRAALRWSLRRAARVIAVSENLRRFAIELGVDPSRAVTIPNGIEVGDFYPRDRAAARARLGIPPGALVVLSAGSLCERKGHHRVARALADLAGVRLVVAGGPAREGNYEPDIRRAVSEARLDDRVHFTGHVDAAALAELMSAADVFCLASSREGWPNVVHEAMACGAPVVATAVGGLPEMIPSSDYGEVVPAADPVALAAALHRALTRSWDRDRIRALAHSRSWEQVAREVVSELSAAVL